MSRNLKKENLSDGGKTFTGAKNVILENKNGEQTRVWKMNWA